MERKIPNFVLVLKGVTYIMIEDAHSQPMLNRLGTVVRKPHRLG